MAIANVEKAIECMSSLNAKELSKSVLEQYENLLKEYKQTKKTLRRRNDEAKESVPTEPSEIDLVMFGNPMSIREELTMPFDGQAILLRTVSLKVKEIEQEYKDSIGSIIQEAFRISEKTEEAQNKLLAEYKLPTALYRVTGEQELPQDLWEKVKQCKELNNSEGLVEILFNLTRVSNKNRGILGRIKEKIDQEEKEDNILRHKYISNWIREHSSKLNHEIKVQIVYYGEKYDQRRKTDEKLNSVVYEHKSKFSFLDMNKEELVKSTPKVLARMEEVTPSASKLTELLMSLVRLKMQTETHIGSITKCFEVESATNEMIKIHKKLLEKEKTFEMLRMKYKAKLEELKKVADKRREILEGIKRAIVEFDEEKKLVIKNRSLRANEERSPMTDIGAEDFKVATSTETRIKFLRDLYHACNSFNKYYTYAKQGLYFHSQLAVYLERLEKFVNDYITARGLSRDSLLAKLTPTETQITTKLTQAKEPTSAEVKKNPSSAFDQTKLFPDEMWQDLPEEGKASRVKASIDPNTIGVPPPDVATGNEHKARVIPLMPENIEDLSTTVLLGYDRKADLRVRTAILNPIEI